MGASSTRASSTRCRIELHRPACPGLSCCPTSPFPFLQSCSVGSLLFSRGSLLQGLQKRSATESIKVVKDRVHTQEMLKIALHCISMFGNARAELYGLASAYNKHLGEHLTKLAQHGIHTAESTSLISMLKLYDGLHAAETPFNVKEEVSRWITAAVNLAVGYEEVLRMEQRIIEDKAYLSINEENRINADGSLVQAAGLVLPKSTSLSRRAALLNLRSRRI